METYHAGGSNHSWAYVKTAILLFCLTIFPLFLLLAADPVLSQLLPLPATYPAMTILSQISQVRSSLAALILTFPLIVFLLLSLRKDFRKDNNILSSGMFKFLYYLFFAVPALLTAGYLILLVSAFLEGNATANLLFRFGPAIIFFVPGILSVSTIIRSKTISFLSLSSLLSFYLLIALVVFIPTFIKLGPPWLAKNIQDDNNKITAVNEISAGIQDYFYQFKKLPNSLNELKSAYPDRTFLKNTVINYSYATTGNQNYKLCTSFNMSSEELQKYGYIDNKFRHLSGPACFDFTVTTNFCRTLNTKMIVGADNHGQIGCDIKVNGQIDLYQSYCEGQKTHQKEFLIRDAFGRPNQYFATLTGLDMDEEVKVFASTLSGLKIECLPSLNK